MKKKLVKAVKKNFLNHFKTNPIMVFSPGRINLIGEHTDYNDGFVFPAAINKGIVLAINKTNKSKSSVHALNKNDVYSFTINNIKPLENGGWKNYILGVVSEIKKLGLHIGNFNAVFAGNIPAGAGLSSSAALENSFVFGLNELFCLKLTKMQMILISQKAEHNFAGVKCGIMDQYASMFGVKKSALLLDCRTVTAITYKIDFKKYKLILINTNVKHNLSDSAYNDRRAVCENTSKMLKINALRDASIKDIDAIKNNISTEDYLKITYVIEENNRAQAFAKAMKENNLNLIGKLMYQSHNGLSSKYKVSCNELDFLVEKAKENPNILGARLMGGGFGGCTINLILKSDFKRFKKHIAKAYKKQFNKNCSVYKVKLANGTQLI